MSIITALPGICPTVRPCEMGEWPQGRMKMRNGRTVRWGLSSRPTSNPMELRWENITYAQAEELVQTWDANYGIYGEVTLPPGIMGGASAELAAMLALPFAGATWHFATAPVVTAVKARRCTVTMPIAIRGFVEYNA